MAKLKIALVGTGNICHTHMASYVKRDDVEIISCADIDFEKAKAFAQKYNIPQAFPSVEALIEGSKPDFIDVCTWPAAHATVAIVAANAGIHVICEKPTCHKLEDAIALHEAVKKNNVLFQLAVPLRYDFRAQHIRKLVDEGEFGNVFFGKTAYVRQRGIPGGWFSCSKYSGGGPIIDVGVHRIDLAWYMMGCPKPISVSANASYLIGDYRVKPDTEIVGGVVSATNNWAGAAVNDYVFDVEDCANGFFRFENGATLFFETSWSFNGPVNNSTQIAGDKAGCTLDPFVIYRSNGDKLIEEPQDIAAGNIFDNEFDHFINCVRTGNLPSSDIDQALQMEAMLCGIYDSSKAGKEIELKF